MMLQFRTVVFSGSLLRWNVNELTSKTDDPEFINYIHDYDTLLFSETWHKRLTDLNLFGFHSFRLSRPKGNKKAKRYSGGLVVFFKDWLYGKIEPVKTDNRGILWMKLKREFFSLERDIYICLTYIPPEESNVYKNRESSLFEFDFFEKLSDDLRVF